MIEGEKIQREVRASDVTSPRERAFLAISDFSTILMVIIDLLYLGGVITIDGLVLMTLNIILVGASFVGYNLKKRIRKRVEREKMERKKLSDANH